jgi:hypothetical protein
MGEKKSFSERQTLIMVCFLQPQSRSFRLRPLAPPQARRRLRRPTRPPLGTRCESRERLNRGETIQLPTHMTFPG